MPSVREGAVNYHHVHPPRVTFDRRTDPFVMSAELEPPVARSSGRRIRVNSRRRGLAETSARGPSFQTAPVTATHVRCTHAPIPRAMETSSSTTHGGRGLQHACLRRVWYVGCHILSAKQHDAGELVCHNGIKSAPWFGESRQDWRIHVLWHMKSVDRRRMEIVRYCEGGLLPPCTEAATMLSTRDGPANG
ncbi:hypothetical protein BD309DRAFT_729512 [Dichomitus squalens]|nr:hypothetical protein BD309DRAFT_729512 [Dichomitus squalens]